MADETKYIVVMDENGEYSMWPAGEELPPGWSDTGKSGTQDECLEFIMSEMQARGVTTN
jgi:MbtH protein